MSQLNRGATIRIATRDRAVFEGRYERLDGDSLVLSSRTTPHVLLTQIDTLLIRDRNPVAGFVKGSLIGGALGAVGVLTLAYSISHSTSEHCNCGDTIVGTVAVSALLGGVIGLGVGGRNWRRLWPQ